MRSRSFLQIHGPDGGAVPALAAMRLLALAACLVLAAGVLGLAAPSAAPAVTLGASGSFAWAAPLTFGVAGGNATNQLVAGPKGSIYSLADVGATWAVEPYHSAIAVTRLGPDRHVIWRTVYRGPGDIWASGAALATAPNGDVVVAGSERAAANAGTSLLVARFRARDGKRLWKRVKSSPASGGTVTNAGAWALAIDDAGGIYVAGHTASSDTTPDIGLAIKYTATGNTVWTREKSGLGINYNGIAVDADHSAYLTGIRVVAAGPPMVTEGVVLRLNARGREVWSQPVKSATGFFQTREPIVRGKSLFVGGLEWVQDAPNPAYGWPLVAKTRLATGERLWTTHLSAIPGRMQQPQGMAVDGNGDVVFVGGSQYVDLPGKASLEYMGWVYKLSGSTGKPAWHQWFFNDIGTDGYDGGLSDVAVDGKGRVYCAGSWSLGIGGADWDAVVVRYSAAAGTAQKSWRLGGAAHDYDGFNKVLVGAGGVFAGGSLKGVAGETSFVQRLRP